MLLNKPNDINDSAAAQRASSSSPSTRSDGSQTTLVGYQAESGVKPDVMSGTAIDEQKTGCLSFLKIFRTKSPGKVTSPAMEKPTLPEIKDASMDSQYIKLVHVLSPQKDEKSHHIPKEAQCIFDTGNQQGNIVSRNLVINVLGYREAEFQKLTEAEESGALSITGHRLIPIGAIDLTWYYRGGSRVFRNMRFLVSEHPLYDLVVGARSIRKENILDVLNLAATFDVEKFDCTRFDKETNARLEALRSKMIAANQKRSNLDSAIGKLKIKNDPRKAGELTEKENKRSEAKEEHQKAEKKFDIEAFRAEIGLAEKTGQKDAAAKLQKDFEEKYPKDHKD